MDDTLTYDGVLADSGSNPETVARSASVGVSVIQGCLPITWAVSGTGTDDWSIGGGTGRSNTLTAGASETGTAIVTATDACENVVTIEVRCTSGSWVQLCHHTRSTAGGTGCGGSGFSFD